jgi:hypothetical protein
MNAQPRAEPGASHLRKMVVHPLVRAIEPTGKFSNELWRKPL